MALMDDPDLRETLNNLLGAVAGDHFEGWADYWVDEEKVYEQIVSLIEEWESTCAEAAAPAERGQ